jgi:hypothetical protein
LAAVEKSFGVLVPVEKSFGFGVLVPVEKSCVFLYL